MGDKFHIEQDELVKFVGEIDHRLYQYIEFIEELKAAFNSVCRTEGFEGTKANAAKEYFSLYYGDTELSIPELIKGAAGGISDALYMLELKYDQFDSEEKFVLDEESLDEEISMIKSVENEDFSALHQSVVDTINSVSDLIFLNSPDSSTYEEVSDSLIEKLTYIKNNVYDIENEIINYVERLSEQVNSIITLVDSYSNKDKRLESYDSSEEIITRELEDALEKYYIGNKIRVLNADKVKAGKERHNFSVERLKLEAAVARKKEGLSKMFNGTVTTILGVGCFIASCGSSYPILAALGYLSGTSTTIFGVTNFIEGAEIEYYGVHGDITTPSHNLIRDYVFDGDQELYNLSSDFSTKLSSLVLIMSPYAQSLSASNVSSGVAAAKASVFSSGVIASEFSSYGVEKFCEKKGYNTYTTLFLQGLTYIGTLSAICKFGNLLIDGVLSKTATDATSNSIIEQEVISSDTLKGESGRTFKSQYEIPTGDDGYTKSNLDLGKKVHKEYKASDVDNITKFKEYTLPSGKRVDFIDFENKTIYELKPYNPRQIKNGTKQLENYLKEIEDVYGDGWTTVLDTY